MTGADARRQARGPLARRWRALVRATRHRGLLWLIGQSLLTVATLAVVLGVIGGTIGWTLGAAEWEVVGENLRLLLVGRYPADALWRPVAVVVGLSALLGLSAPTLGPIARGVARLLGLALAGLLALPLAAPLVVRAGDADLGALVLRLGGGDVAAGAALTALAAADLSMLVQALGPGRVALTTALGALLAGTVIAGRVVRHTADDGPARERSPLARALRMAWLLAVPVALLLLRGAGPLAVVRTNDWGGLLLTLVLAVAAIALSFPIGVLLALGRRSPLPLVRGVSVLYIELIRGVPLVTVLYMASLFVPLLLPQGANPAAALRAIAGLTLFSAAYVAEDVRGGLQAVDRGQYDAARALGLGTAGTYRHIVLPQAIRIVIPAIVGQFISLFKDTSLVVIIGLRELLGIAQAVVNQPDYLGRFREALVFIALIYFVFSYAMSRASRQLEADAKGGSR